MEMKLTSIRISEAAHTRADGLVDHLSQLHAGKANRSDVLRLAIRLGLDQLTAQRDALGVSDGAA